MSAETAVVRNPILPGFHPDPSIVRVGHDYYIANSTFEWFPGIRLHHSRDLVHWEPVGHALTDPLALDLRGVEDSGGVWAPSLSHDGGLFWLVYAVIYTKDGPFKDLDIFVVRSASIQGPWSVPVHLGSGGFDPSIFHDDDGRHWLVNMTWDHRPDRSAFGGIVLQEVDLDRGGLAGPQRLILTSDELVEGPNLYRREGWYYLMLAQGGTGWNHGILMSRSRDINGPYAVDPQGSLLTSRDNVGLRLQKAGHGELVETPGGEWFLVHLASRPLLTGRGRRCILGRETCLQRVTWTGDEWLRLAQGGHWPADEVAVPVGLPVGLPAVVTVIEQVPLTVHLQTAAPGVTTSQRSDRDEFDSTTLSSDWSSLREPVTDRWLSLTERPGWLRLRGRHSTRSRFSLSLVARRLTTTDALVSTCVEFVPQYPGQRAGLVCWYDTNTHYFFGVSGGEGGPRIVLAVMNDGNYSEQESLSVRGWARVHLRAELHGIRLQFSVSSDGASWQEVGLAQDASILSDDHGSSLRFTGAFVGLTAQDSFTGRLSADFDHFELRDLSEGNY
jgi:xylan 1,4-beta-xylosidase